MASKRHITHDISYVHAAETRGGRTMIRLLENTTGRIRLIRRAAGYEKEVEAGRDFWTVIVERYGLSLDVMGGSLANIPREGPVILIANHPYGILDGVMMGHILSRTRSDFRIMAHQVFTKSETLGRAILPVSFEENRAAMRLNIDTRKKALSFLAEGGAIGTFPGGTVSTGIKMFAHPMDPEWRIFTARMISKSNAVVVPIFFDGHTSRLFQMVSHLNYTVRKGLMLKEFRKRVDSPVRVVIGEPLGRDVLEPLAKDGPAMMDYLRKVTYGLSPKPLKYDDYGYEYEAGHRA